MNLVNDQIRINLISVVKNKQKRKDSRQRELEYMKSKFQQKLLKLQKQLIVNKQYARFDIFNTQEEQVSRAGMNARNQKTHIKGKTFATYSNNEFQFDKQIEKIMSKHSSQYDISEMIASCQSNGQRRQLIGKDLEEILFQVQNYDTIHDHVQEEPEHLEESFQIESGLVSPIKQQQSNGESRKNSVFVNFEDQISQETGSKVRMIEKLHDSIYNTQEQSPKTEKKPRQIQKLITIPQIFTHRSSVSSPTEILFSEKLRQQVKLKNQIKVIVKGHLHKMGMSPKLKKVDEDFTRDSRGNMKSSTTLFQKIENLNTPILQTPLKKVFDQRIQIPQNQETTTHRAYQYGSPMLTGTPMQISNSMLNTSSMLQTPMILMKKRLSKFSQNQDDSINGMLETGTPLMQTPLKRQIRLQTLTQSQENTIITDIQKLNLIDHHSILRSQFLKMPQCHTQSLYSLQTQTNQKSKDSLMRDNLKTIDNDNIQSVLTQCDKMHTNLHKMQRNFVSKQKRHNKQYNMMNFKLESSSLASLIEN